MALVKIVYVATPDRRGPDLSRIGRVEDIHPDLARLMVDEGSAVWATEEDVLVDEARHAAEREDATASDVPVAAPADAQEQPGAAEVEPDTAEVPDNT